MKTDNLRSWGKLGRTPRLAEGNGRLDAVLLETVALYEEIVQVLYKLLQLLHSPLCDLTSEADDELY